MVHLFHVLQQLTGPVPMEQQSILARFGAVYAYELLSENSLNYSLAGNEIP
jgi:hypothetical protein